MKSKIVADRRLIHSVLDYRDAPALLKYVSIQNQNKAEKNTQVYMH